MKLFISKIVLATLLLSSCSMSYYQFFQTTASNADEANENRVEFATDSISFLYDLWSSKGDPGITLINNSDQTLVVDLKNSFFVKNGLAIPYYDGKEISFRSSSGVSAATPILDYTGYTAVGASQSSGASLTVPQEPFLIVPPNTFRVLSGFKLINGYYRICDVDPYPSRGKKSFKTFSEDDAPLSFSNIITYAVGNDTNTVHHDFFVSEINTRYAPDVEQLSRKGPCGETNNSYRVNTEQDARTFYFKYVNN